MRPILITLLAIGVLVAAYYVFARPSVITVHSNVLYWKRRELFFRYWMALWMAVSSGIWIAGTLRWLSATVLIALLFLAAYLLAHYTMGLAYVDDDATERLASRAKEIQGREDIGKESMKMITVPRLPGWKVFLVLGVAQLVGIGTRLVNI